MWARCFPETDEHTLQMFSRTQRCCIELFVRSPSNYLHEVFYFTDTIYFPIEFFWQPEVALNSSSVAQVDFGNAYVL
jgi:hypothetical protein